MVSRSLSSISFGLAARLACALMLCSNFGCARKDNTPGVVAPASAGEAAPAATARDARSGLASIFVVHLVNDFDGFEKYLEAGATERAKAGVKGYLLTKLGDGRAVIHFFADEIAVVEDALRSPDMEKYLDREGAPDASLLWLTRDVFVKAPAEPPAGETYSLYLKLETGDLPALERELLDQGTQLAKRGVIGYGLHRSTARETIAIVHFVGTVKEELEALPERPEFRELLVRAKSRIDSKALVGVDVARQRPK
jgi:hypothetical protein